MKNLNISRTVAQAILVIDGAEISLNGESDLSEIIDQIGDAEKMALLPIEACLSWDIRCFELVLAIVSRTEGRLTFSGPNNRLCSDFYEALLGSFVDPTPRQLGVFKERAALTIEWLHPQTVPMCCQKYVDRVKSLGIVGETRRDMEKLVAATRKKLECRAREAQASSNHRLQSLAEVVADLPIDGLDVPFGFRIDEEGIAFHGQEPFVSVPIVIASRLIDIDDGGIKVRVAWKSSRGWHSELVSRRTICDTRQILALADVGMPVHSGNAAQIVKYLAGFESQNEMRIPTRKVTSTLGHRLNDGWGVFVLPKRSVAASNDAGTVEFHTSDPGVQQIVAGFREGGTFKRWLNAVKSVRAFPAVMLGLYASLAPVLHPVICFPNVIVDYSGRTSGGKTIVLRFAASPWGNPDETSPNSIVQTWGSTKTYLERASATINHLPLVVDDTKNAKREDLVASSIYSLTQGRVPGRGTITGIQTSGHYQGIVISSGERPITSFSKDGGTRARTIALWGSPFGVFSPASGETARQFDEQIKANFGQAGPRFVEFVMTNFDRWEAWRTQHKTFVDEYTSWAQSVNNQFAARLAPSLAAIAVASRITHECFAFEFAWTDPIEPLWHQIASASAEADQARAALEVTFDWAVANQKSFDCDGTNELPHGGYLGRWVRKLPVPSDDTEEVVQGAENWPWLGILTNNLENVLDEHGFDSDAVIRTWWDNGWLATNESGRRTFKTRVGKQPDVRLIAIRRQALREVCGIA